MRCIWLEDGRLELRQVPRPEPREDEALVRVVVAGVCATDLELMRGYMAFCGVPGHEFVGVVERAPADPGLEGARVVGEINAACGVCPTCRAGRERHCPRRTVLGIAGRDGVFAEHALLPTRNLLPVPDGLSDEAAVFTEPLAAALEILDQVPIDRGQRVLLVGAGRLGQLIARALGRTGCELAVIARHPRQVELLAAVGVACVAPEQVADGAHDVVVEASGSPAGFDIARRAVRPRGTLVLKSTYADALPLDISRVVVDELTLVGSRCGPFAPALELLARGEVDPAPLVQARHGLSDGLAALGAAAAPGALKVLIDPAR